MGNILNKYNDYLDCYLILTSLLPSNELRFREVDIVYQHLIYRGSCVKTEIKNTQIQITEYHNSETYLQKIHCRNIPIIFNIIIDDLPLQMISIFESEKTRVRRILDVFVNSFCLDIIKPSHLADLPRHDTKNEYTSYINIKTLIQKATKILGRKLQSRKDVVRFLYKLGYHNVYPRCNAPEVLEIIYFTLQTFDHHLVLLDYGIQFYNTFPTLFYADISPKINTSLICENETFYDIRKTPKNICIRINTHIPVVKRVQNVGEVACKYLCFVKTKKRSNIIFSDGNH